jgi:hypothetical protein
MASGQVRFGVRINARRAAAVTLVLAVLLVIGGYAAYRALQRVTATPPPPPGCQAGTGQLAVALDPGQASIAATIAGVATRRKLPRQAVTIALATAMQESDLENLDYGDRDSVGVFQQRPSEGWGTTADLEDPVYATTKFYAALVQIPRYTKIPIDVAAQDVQRSADGSAYSQFDYTAGLLSGDLTGQPAHSVTCWYIPAATPAASPDLKQAEQGLKQTFGPEGRKATLVRITTGRSAKIEVRRGQGWTVASWLVTHAEEYQISEVRYAGYEWKAADGSMGWQRNPDPGGTPQDGIVAG